MAKTDAGTAKSAKVASKTLIIMFECLGATSGMGQVLVVPYPTLTARMKRRSHEVRMTCHIFHTDLEMRVHFI